VSCRPGFFLSACCRACSGDCSWRGSSPPTKLTASTSSATTPVLPMRKIEWVVYSKRPFGGPQAVLAYLSRYTHRVAIANNRLIACDRTGVTFQWKDYRIKGRDRYKRMTLATDEFIRRFLIHVLPKGLHRIRHYGLFAKSSCADNIARARELLAVAKPEGKPAALDPSKPSCPCCGGRMIIIEVFARGTTPRHRPTAATNRITIDTS
jgi:Putative transposase